MRRLGIDKAYAFLFGWRNRPEVVIAEQDSSEIVHLKSSNKEKTMSTDIGNVNDLEAKDKELPLLLETLTHADNKRTMDIEVVNTGNSEVHKNGETSDTMNKGELLPLTEIETSANDETGSIREAGEKTENLPTTVVTIYRNCDAVQI